MKSTQKEVFKKLNNANNIIFYTGAEISSDAGISTLREPHDIWHYYDTNELSSLEGFEKNPQLVWDWYQNRRQSVANIGVNESYEIISLLQKKLNNASIITQNVDCQHQIAGSKSISELRGNFFQCLCNDCKRPYLEYDLNSKKIPICKHCEGYIRPNVVWFNEKIDLKLISDSKKNIINSDVLILIGLYNDMYPTKEFVELAKSTDTFIIEFSTDETIFSDIADYIIHGKFSNTLPNFLSEFETFNSDKN